MKFLVLYLNYFWQELALKIKGKYINSVKLSFEDNYRKKMRLFHWKDSNEMLTPESYLIEYLIINLVVCI